MPNFNRLTIIGHLGADPELRHTGSGEAVCNFRVATTEKWKDRSGAKQERTEWHSVTCWGKKAEFAGTVFRKGLAVMCEGPLRTRSYKDNDGLDRYKTEMVANEVMILSPKSAHDRSTHADESPPVSIGDDDIPF